MGRSLVYGLRGKEWGGVMKPTLLHGGKQIGSLSIQELDEFEEYLFIRLFVLTL